MTRPAGGNGAGGVHVQVSADTTLGTEVALEDVNFSHNFAGECPLARQWMCAIKITILVHVRWGGVCVDVGGGGLWG